MSTATTWLFGETPRSQLGQKTNLASALPESASSATKHHSSAWRKRAISAASGTNESNSKPHFNGSDRISDGSSAVEDRLDRIEYSIRGLTQCVTSLLEAKDSDWERSPSPAGPPLRHYTSFRNSVRTEEEEREREAEEVAQVIAEERQRLARSPGTRLSRDSHGEPSWRARAMLLARRNRSGRQSRSGGSVRDRSSSDDDATTDISGGTLAPLANMGDLNGSLELFGDLYEGKHAGHGTSSTSSESRSRGVLLPWSRLLLTWDLVCSCALLIMCFYLPFRLSFLSEHALSWPGDAWLLVIDACYIADIVVSMNSAFYDYLGNLVTQRKLIIRRYLRGWMLLDLLACAPIDWLYLAVVASQRREPSTRLLLALRALRLGRTLRLMTHRRVFVLMGHGLTKLKIRASYTTIVQRTVITIIFAHCNACGQFLISVLDDLPEDCWVVRAGIQSLPTHTQYMASIFHTTSQMLAVGNGLVGPVRDSEYVTFIISLVLGANLYAVFVGTLISVIEDANGSHREFCKRTDMLQTWMAQRQLPRSLRRKLETYYEILFPGGHAFDDSRILASLSPPLLEEVCRHKCSSLLRQLAIDWRTSPGLARRLSLSLERVVFVAGDVIVHEGQPNRAMYFIQAGCVCVHIRAIGAKPVKELRANQGMNSLFGEMALLSPQGRASASIAVPYNGYCDAFVLSRERFTELTHIYPSFRRRIESVVAERERENLSVIQQQDLPRSQQTTGHNSPSEGPGVSNSADDSNAVWDTTVERAGGACGSASGFGASECTGADTDDAAGGILCA